MIVQAVGDRDAVFGDRDPGSDPGGGWRSASIAWSFAATASPRKGLWLKAEKERTKRKNLLTHDYSKRINVLFFCSVFTSVIAGKLCCTVYIWKTSFMSKLVAFNS